MRGKMRDMAKRMLAVTASLTLLLPCLSLPTFAEDAETGKVFDQTQPVTVVAKRVTGDDTYFEISLEVNEDYDKYSSVGVVLRYDPEYITPAESWAEDAGKADMSENNSWATRRALPTLGVDTWSTHTALAYEEAEPQADADGKKYGYLYLSAEHPRPEEGPNPDATVAPEAALEPKLGEPEAEPDATPKPETGTAPVVAVRFVYNADGDTKTGADVKESLTKAWLEGANATNGLNDTHTTNWDYDWRANTILTLAGDDIAAKSPAQYPFVIYTQNYEEKAFMFNFPTEPFTQAAGGLRSVDDYKYVVGSSITPENRLKDTDITVVTLEGESALKTGGLSLSDIYTILFFDWDDSLLGTLTAGVGEDPTEAVHNYTKEKFVHPELRKIGYASLSDTEKKQRKYNYRGEYPEDGPASGNPLAKTGAYGDGSDEPGSKYPLTNKLDYAFAGKNLVDADHPYTFAYGWTQVLPDAPDYSDTGKYPGQTADILPKAMEDTFTAETPTENKTYGFAPELDAAGAPVDGKEIPDLIACDFSKITKAELAASDGNLYVKAAYSAGEMLNRQSAGNTLTDTDYTAVGPIETGTVGASTSTVTTYSFAFSYERINQYGYGVYRIKEPSINMALVQTGAAASTPLRVMMENSDKMSVFLTPTNAVKTVDYTLRDSYDANIIIGNQRSAISDLEQIAVGGPEGIGFQISVQEILENAYNNKSGTWLTVAKLKALNLTSSTAGKAYTNLTVKKAQTPLIELVKKAEEAGQDYLTLTWYQIQYALINTTDPYVDKATAKTWCEQYPALKANADSL